MKQKHLELLANLTPTQKEEIAGKADCGCVYHAEDGMPCEHDVELYLQKHRA